MKAALCFPYSQHHRGRHVEIEVWGLALVAPRCPLALWVNIMSDGVRSTPEWHVSSPFSWYRADSSSLAQRTAARTFFFFPFCVLSLLILTWQQRAVGNNRAITQICISTLFYMFSFHFKCTILSPICCISDAKWGLCETPWVQHKCYTYIYYMCVAFTASQHNKMNVILSLCLEWPSVYCGKSTFMFIWNIRHHIHRKITLFALCYNSHWCNNHIHITDFTASVRFKTTVETSLVCTFIALHDLGTYVLCL